ncbi:DNA repair protein RecN [Candidatus Contubernalis alkaliaceticus]|uniref:DNA repair protein RecN n=1 Tax=Candidatus Contubernalis alkaliaceticus TaxID=338645 RepID=UPI001F4C221A|nr:DNA repair protein RecN [Candidatus Contubernalis alkalaceticus]UNC92538.1 DNA repair protein RecN [Candidatus Contubernalis alkalaceticus]
MLTELYIKNIALIDSLKMTLCTGLNILTGETGAGKSIIMGAIKLLIGARASSESIRTGTENALVEGIFQFKSPPVKEKINKILSDYGLNLEEGDILFLGRELSLAGKNICRVNGRMVPLNAFKEIGQYLIEFHGQGQQQLLSRSINHQDLLDNLGGKEISQQKERVRKLFFQWKKCRQEIENLYLDETEKERKLDLLQYQYEEITQANLSEEEEKTLLEEKMRINNREKLISSLSIIYERLYEGTNNQSVVESMGLIQKELESVIKYDESLIEKIPGIDESLAVLTEISLEIKEYLEDLHYQPEEIQKVEERLEIINNLKRKYGPGIADILKFGRNVKEQIELLLGSERKHQELQNMKTQLEKNLLKESGKLRELRIKVSHFLEKQISDLLTELEIPQGIFKVSLEKTEILTSRGFDRIEFLFSANPGEETKPLSKIASGGEISRIMLALRTVLVEADEVPSVVFDEIDVGLGGASLQAVAEKLNFISRHRQVICVTHAPQVASMGDRHFRISKKVEEDRTFTVVELLNKDIRKKEVARMIDGADLSEITLTHAQEMLDRVNLFKLK